MNRRTLVLASVALLPPSVLAWPASAQRRPLRCQQTSDAERTARRRPGGGLTASTIRTRITTRTFTSKVPLTIPDGAPGTTEGPATPYPSTLRVSGFTQGRILKVRVRLFGLTHTDSEDLDVLLVSPGNIGVLLMSDVGETGVSGVNLTFDQDAPGRLPDPVVSGTFQPTNEPANPELFPAPAPTVMGQSLTRFNNTNPNGNWKLFVVDDTAGDTGSLGGWSLTIRARVRVPHRHRRAN